MLTFIVPLQSKAVSKDWNRVCEITRRTLNSVCAQRDPRFNVVLVCNESPVNEDFHPRLHILAEDFQVPKDPSERMKDKWVKVRRGMLELKRLESTHVMVVDADDLVSNRLAALVAANDKPDHPGWIIRNGYIYNSATGFLFSLDGFNERCGTSSIINIQNMELPHDMENPTDCPILNYGHSAIEKYFQSAGNPLEVCPFPGAIYVAGTDENDSGVSRRWFRGKREFLLCLQTWRRLTGTRRDEFCIR